VRFVLLFRNDPIAAGAMLAGGRAGAEFLEKTIGQFGGTVEDAIPVTGRYDAVVTCEFPSHEAMLAFSLSATSDGQYVEAMPAISRGELDTARSIAREVKSAQVRDAEQATPASP
jgi:uncharacterized protein with GYD domain